MPEPLPHLAEPDADGPTAARSAGLRVRSLLAGVVGQIDGVLANEPTRLRLPATAGSVRFPGTFDPQVSVGVRARGRRGGRCAQGAAAGLHQLSGASGAGPAPLRDVSIT